MWNKEDPLHKKLVYMLMEGPRGQEKGFIILEEESHCTAQGLGPLLGGSVQWRKAVKAQCSKAGNRFVESSALVSVSHMEAVKIFRQELANVVADNQGPVSQAIVTKSNDKSRLHLA